MARRVPLYEADTAIKIIEEDGGVILTQFSSITDVEKVNGDAAPFITAFTAEVRPLISLQAKQLPSDSFVLPFESPTIDVTIVASIAVSSPGNSTLHTPFRAQHNSTRKMASATTLTEDFEPLPADSQQTIPLVQ